MIGASIMYDGYHKETTRKDNEMEMVEFTCDAMYEMLESTTGHTVEGEVINGYRYETGVPMMFTVMGHELVSGIEVGANKPLRIITTLRSDTKLVKVGFDVEFTGEGYDMRNCEIVSEENI